MLMEYFWHIISSGLLIGIFISAPMGPIGMLVIQRTLNKGRRPALFTGVGAALSDLTYSLLTGLGLSFITDFIIAKELLLQIIGSVVLIAFALYLFKKNPTLALKKPDNAPNTFWKDFGTGFLFTFANPLILFFIIGIPLLSLYPGICLHFRGSLDLVVADNIFHQQGQGALQRTLAMDIQPHNQRHTFHNGACGSL